MKTSVVTSLLCLFTAGTLFGQAKPFPQATGYPYGYLPTTVTSAKADSIYNLWKSKFLSRDCSGQLCVLSDVSGVLKSQGTGYGLILTAYYGEKTLYDSLLAFYLSKRTTSSNGAMGWEATCSDWQDQGSATEGDLDATYSCIVAYNQWGSEYLAWADTILNVLEANYIVTCGNNINVIVPGISGGSAWGGCSCTDLSHYTPAYFRLFAAADQKPIWTALADSTYTILNASADATTGLVPDWQAYNIDTTGSGCGGSDTSYGYDACRVPWRIAIDYLWNGNMNANAWCVKISNWANSVGAANITSGYLLNGTANGQNHNGSFIGGFAVGTMCDNQSTVNTFGAELMKSNDQDYYNLSLKAMYLLVLSGNFWKPDIGTPVLGDSKRSAAKVRPAIALTGRMLTVTGVKGLRSVQIVTSDGRTVASRTGKPASGLQFDVCQLGRGLYIVNIATVDGGSYAIKFVKP